jgi:hypothetical protein
MNTTSLLKAGVDQTHIDRTNRILASLQTWYTQYGTTLCYLLPTLEEELKANLTDMVVTWLAEQMAGAANNPALYYLTIWDRRFVAFCFNGNKPTAWLDAVEQAAVKPPQDVDGDWHIDAPKRALVLDVHMFVRHLRDIDDHL